MIDYFQKFKHKLFLVKNKSNRSSKFKYNYLNKKFIIFGGGTGFGYDLELVNAVSEAVKIPVVAACGAGKLEHFKEAVNYGASAVAAGDLFTFQGKRKAVLITYPKYQSLQELFNE